MTIAAAPGLFGELQDLLASLDPERDAARVRAACASRLASVPGRAGGALALEAERACAVPWPGLSVTTPFSQDCP